MPDQAPPAPEGCLGVFFDSPLWFAVVEDSCGSACLKYWSVGTKSWKWLDGDYTESVCAGFAKLAKENAELRASQPSEEDRAVLWLMKETTLSIDWKDEKWQVLRFETYGSILCQFNPVREAKKLGWGG